MADHDRVRAALGTRRTETPSWGYGNSGTRFKVFPQEGVPRNPHEKIDDAATVHRFTGVAPTVSLHVPWDRLEDQPPTPRSATRPARPGPAETSPPVPPPRPGSRAGGAEMR